MHSMLGIRTEGYISRSTRQRGGVEDNSLHYGKLIISGIHVQAELRTRYDYYLTHVTQLAPLIFWLLLPSQVLLNNFVQSVNVKNTVYFYNEKVHFYFFLLHLDSQKAKVIFVRPLFSKALNSESNYALEIFKQTIFLCKGCPLLEVECILFVCGQRGEECKPAFLAPISQSSFM